MDHITTPQYHPRSNGQTERFVDTLKWALKNALWTPSDRPLQQFLQVYRITSNPNTPMGRSPAETKFARKVNSVFDKLIPRKAKFKKTVSPHKKHFYPGDKVLLKAYKNNMTFWEVGTIKQRIGKLVYIVQGPKNTHKRHMNQLRKCSLNESEESPQNTREEPIDAIFDHFDIDTSQVSPEVWHSGRKRKFTQPLDVNPKRQTY